MTARVVSHVRRLYTVLRGVLGEALVEIGLLQPVDPVGKGTDRATSDLGVDAVIETANDVTLDCLLVRHHPHILIHLLVYR